MAKFKTGDLFATVNFDKYDIVFITTNALLNKNKQLVMGAGIAKIAMEKFPELPDLLGKSIAHILTMKLNKWYGIAFAYTDKHRTRHKVAAFQTKVSPYDASTLALINYSTECLIDFAMNNQDLNIALNYPGIGLGQLNKKDVEPIVNKLPDNVTIWEL